MHTAWAREGRERLDAECTRPVHAILAIVFTHRLFLGSSPDYFQSEEHDHEYQGAIQRRGDGLNAREGDEHAAQMHAENCG